jgi:uncharacterized membrane-anchored protein YhcB (DUF1043 family)
MKTAIQIIVLIVLIITVLKLQENETEKQILKGIQIENVEEMEETPPELYIYFNKSKYMLDTKTNELTHIAKF